jgi:hypothetical protein
MRTLACPSLFYLAPVLRIAGIKGKDDSIKGVTAPLKYHTIENAVWKNRHFSIRGGLPAVLGHEVPGQVDQGRQGGQKISAT